MRSSYAVTDELDFMPMDEFQKEQFNFRQQEWDSYRTQLNVKQGDLTDPAYFDFISFVQYASIAEGMRNYMGLPYLAESTGAHALMSAVTNSKYDFLSKDSRFLHRSERIFASVMAERIMADPNRAMELRSGFCFFARSGRWREFASAEVAAARRAQ